MMTRAVQQSSFCHGFSLKDNQSGFTLLELLLATLIASIVIGMLSVALTFSLSLWQREQNSQHDSAQSMVDLLQFQLAGLDASPLPMGGRAAPLFLLEEDSIAFVTAHSVKAMSRGAPAVVRYVFDPAQERLYYSEMPFSPHRMKRIEEFLEVTPSGQGEGALFFSVHMSDFSMVAEQEEGESFSTESIERTIPHALILTWKREAGSPQGTAVLRLNYLFPPVAVAHPPVATGGSPF